MNSRYDFSIVRNLRRCQGLTLNELAERSGVTYTTLDNVENNKATPSLKTLDAIAGGLGIPAGKLITLSENQIVQRRKGVHIPQGHNVKLNYGTEMCKVADFNNTKVLRVQAEKGEKVNIPQFHRDCNEICYVLSGSVDLTVSGETYNMQADDSILFDGVLDHAYEQAESGEYITVHIPKDVHAIKNLLEQADEKNAE